MYIKNLKEQVDVAKNHRICSLEYRNLVFDLFKVIYPEIIAKYGESWISKEDFLELLFLEIHSIPKNNPLFLFYNNSHPKLEPIVLNEEMKEDCNFVLFQYQDEFEWVDLNEWLDDLGWYDTEMDQDIQVSDLKHEELITVIKEWQEELADSKDREDAFMLFLLKSELNRRLNSSSM